MVRSVSSFSWAFWVCSCVSFAILPLRAHTTRGHNVLEAAAYKSLLSKGRGFYPWIPNRSGKDILDYLISRQVLRVPPCYPFNGEVRGRCAGEASLDSLEWLPVIGSGEMDAILYRQFSKNGQYFHFMASPGAIYRDPEVDPVTGGPRGLTREAYPRALRFITGMFYDIMEHGEESRRNYRDIYSLIHTIGDSYPAAHAERDTSDWKILYLKPWQATAWEPYLLYWSGWKYFFSDAIHWFPEDERDKLYLRSEVVRPEEVEFYDRNPYLVRRSFLNERGLQAADAIEDLLVTVYTIFASRDGSDSTEHADAGEAWRAYLERHFQCPVDSTTIATLKFGPAPRDEQEWRPMVDIGLRWRTGVESGGRDLLLAMNFAKPPSYIDPFGFAAGYEIGQRRTGNRTLWVGSISFGIYLWQYSDLLALGLDPAIADLTLDGKVLRVDPMMSFVRFDTWIDRRMWLSVEAFRYSFLHGFRTREFSLTAGVAFSKDIPLHWTGRPKWFSPPGEPVGSDWATPDLDSPLRANPGSYGVFHPFTYTFYKDKQHVAVVPIGYTFLWSANHLERTSRTSLGFYLGAGGEQHFGDVWGFLRVGPVVRYRVLPVLTLHAEPVTGQVDVGLSSHTANTLSAAGVFGVVLTIGSFDVDVELMRYSYRTGAFDQKAVAGLKFGVLRE